MPLTIYKSSAGSGKTFTLVKEYLKLVLSRPKDFQHILAITFTNKATEEMKRRVLDNLLEIAQGEHTDMLAVLKKDFEGKYETEELQRRAEEAYQRIIHQYSRFEISTIDSFFSRVVRSFASELDLPLSYELEMNTTLALEEAVDQLFRKLAEQKELRIWLEQYTFDQIEQDKSWNVEGNISELGSNLFKEQFQEGFSRVNIDLKRLEELVGEIKKVIRLYEDGLEASARKAIQLIEKNGLTINDFSYGAAGAAGTFYKIRSGNYAIGTRFIKAANGEQGWAKKKSDKEALVTQLAEGELGSLAREILDYVEKHEKNFRTAKALIRNIYAFGLLETLNSNLKDYRDEQNILLISDNNALIREIVRQDDAPFLFEKIGSFFKHILIDEFQDTSNFQWNNLLPLILNSLASGNQVLIVGDVKQSIYRFRGGNMRLLLEQIDRDLATFREVITYKTLGENYRSLEGIVEFNNHFFELLPDWLQQIEHVNDIQLIQKAYEGHQQQVKKGEGGFVRVELFQPDEDALNWKERALQSLVETIKENQQLGFDFRDFLILVNKNGDMPEIAEHLLSADVPFVSERSLLLKNNNSVRFLIEALRFLQSENDPIGLVNLAHLFAILRGIKSQAVVAGKAITVEELTGFGLPQEFITNRHSLAKMPLFDLVEHLLLEFKLKDGGVFVQRFQDLVLEQMQRGIHSIHGFLEWWDTQGQESSISANEEANAVRLMSVHKSKGLESPIVMMPFADYSFLPNARLHSFWTSELPDYLSDLAFVPLNYSKVALVNTDFENAFVEETLESVMDALNKTYVAFTRAREKLFIMGPHQPSKSGGIHRIHQFLDAILSQFEDILINENNNILKYEYNINSKKQTKSRAGEKVETIETTPEVSYLEHLSIRADSDRFFMLQETAEAEKINRGNQVHEALSRMLSTADVDVVLETMVRDGSLRKEEAEQVGERLESLVAHPQIREWFDGEYVVMAERELLYEGRILKPDRVMISGDSAVVVDYKKEKESEAHQTQVKRYMNAVKSLGYPNTSGFLVYVDSLEIKRVNS